METRRRRRLTKANEREVSPSRPATDAFLRQWLSPEQNQKLRIDGVEVDDALINHHKTELNRFGVTWVL